MSRARRHYPVWPNWDSLAAERAARRAAFALPSQPLTLEPKP